MKLLDIVHGECVREGCHIKYGTAPDNEINPIILIIGIILIIFSFTISIISIYKHIKHKDEEPK